MKNNEEGKWEWWRTIFWLHPSTLSCICVFMHAINVIIATVFKEAVHNESFMLTICWRQLFVSLSCFLKKKQPKTLKMADDLTFMLRGLLAAPAWVVHYCNYAGAMKKKRKKYLLSKCLKGWIIFSFPALLKSGSYKVLYCHHCHHLTAIAPIFHRRAAEVDSMRFVQGTLLFIPYSPLDCEL